MSKFPGAEIVDVRAPYQPAPLPAADLDDPDMSSEDMPPELPTADDGSFDTGQIAPGASATVTLDTAGSFAYHCEIHPSMTATITVT